MLQAIEGQPGLWRDMEDGAIYNAKDFRTFEHVLQFPRSSKLDFVTPETEMWMLSRWSVVLHPWHEVIDPSLKVELAAQHLILARDVPLFRLAEPLARSEKSDLEKRIEKIEEALHLRTQRSRVGDLLNQKVRPQSLITVRIEGSSDALGHLHEMTKHFMLSLRGLRVVKIRR